MDECKIHLNIKACASRNHQANVYFKGSYRKLKRRKDEAVLKKILFLCLMIMTLSAASVAVAATNGEKVANTDIVRASSTVAVSTVTARIAQVAAPSPRPVTNTADNNGNFKFAMNAEDLGLASGDGATDFGVWGMGAYTHFESSASGAKYDADAYNIFLGVDWRATPELLIGLAGGWGSLDLDKKGWGGDGYIKTDDELTVMPYLAYNFTDELIADAAFAYSNGEYSDNDGTGTGHYTSNRYLTNLGLSYYYLIDAWTLSSRVGYMYVHGDLGSYSRGGTSVANPDAYLGQASLQGKAAYLFSCGLEPYVGLTYKYDTSVSSTPVGSDYDEFEGKLGMNYRIDTWTLNLEGGATVGRDDFESYTGQFFIRYEF